MRQHKRRFLFVLSGFLIFQLVVWATVSSVALAGGKIEIDDTHSVSVGMGLRSSLNFVENGAPNGTSGADDFTLDNFRFYMSGQLHEIITFEFNADFAGQGTENLQVLDGVIKFAFNDIFNVWAGRFLPPSDRSNLSGPFFLNAWDFPFVQKYPAIFAGRDEGAAIFGQFNGGQFKYQVGAFEGEKESNGGDSLLYAGRLTLNLWDPEPGYYNSSTYYGGKDVFAIGGVAMFQEDTSVATPPGDFTGWNVDLLIEKNLGDIGVATLEGAFYDYDRERVAVASEGEGYFVLASYLCPNKFGPGTLQGQLQPMVRYQEFDNDVLGNRDQTRLDLALSYIIDGHNARITATYSTEDPANPALSDFDTVKLGLQFQI
ncbi:MAG: porin [Nitrospiria bacterium]